MNPEKARKIAEESYRECEAEQINNTYGQFMTLALLWLHNELHYSEKRLRYFFYSFDDLVRAVRRYDRFNGMAELRDILKNDCNFDIQEEYKKMIEGKGEYPRED